MRYLLNRILYVVAALVLLAVPALHAADKPFSGIWDIADHKLEDGSTYHIYVQLQQKGSAVVGHIAYPWGYRIISETRVSANHFQLLDDKHQLIAEGDRVAENLQLLLKVGTEKNLLRTATPVATEPLPQRLPLPALKAVKRNGLALTPPMGWNSWNKYRENINDKTVRAIADAMVSNGMKDAGYIYVNIDDTWEGPRDAQGNITSNSKFPNMKALADYVHARGLKLGIYSSPGPLTCAGYPGSYGHEVQDARTFAAWGIDYLKYDWCSAHTIYAPSEMHAAYQKMGQALADSGRLIVFSLCQYGEADVWMWGPSVGANLWRTTNDINDTWKRMEEIGFSQDKIGSFAGPTHWNDPDMLEVGNGHMTAEEYRTHFSLWSLLAAPLLAGNDVIHMDAATRSILLNQEVIAVDQDAAGKEATLLERAGDQEIWSRPLANGDIAVGLFNRSASPVSKTTKLATLGVDGATQARDLWAHADLQLSGTEFTVQIPPDGVVMLRIPGKQHLAANQQVSPAP